MRERTGASLPGIVPSNTYRCTRRQVRRDRRQRRLDLQADDGAIGRDDLADDPALADNAGRVKRTERARRRDRRRGRRTRDARRGARACSSAPRCPRGASTRSPTSPRDLHYQARGMIERHKLRRPRADAARHRAEALGDARRTRWIGPGAGRAHARGAGGAGLRGRQDRAAARERRGRTLPCSATSAAASQYYFQNPPELPARRWPRGGAARATEAQAGDRRAARRSARSTRCSTCGRSWARSSRSSSPTAWINTDRMRALFFRGTQSEFELTWKARGQPTNARWRYLFDVIYYTGPILIVARDPGGAVHRLRGYPGTEIDRVRPPIPLRALALPSGIGGLTPFIPSCAAPRRGR